jgi:DNA-binding MarR family transcriptional regulator
MPPTSSDSPRRLRSGTNLGWSLAMVLRRWQERVEEAVEGIPHGTRGYHVLSTVVHDDLPNQGALASRLLIDRTVLTYLLDDLETAGLVERQQDPRDRRARRIVATERGHQVLADAEARVITAEEQVLGGLSEADRASFRQTVGRAAEAIHEAAPDTEPCRAVEEFMNVSADEPQLARRPA